jgi:hypothetical protein
VWFAYRITASVTLYPLTFSAATLQTLPLGYKVVLVAHTASVGEQLTAHTGGVVEVALHHPETGTCVWLRLTGL